MKVKLPVFAVSLSVFAFSVFVLAFPVLQKHYKNLEALALDRDAPDDIVDLTGDIIILSLLSC